jgi:hypothetical protein
VELGFSVRAILDVLIDDGAAHAPYVVRLQPHEGGTCTLLAAE